MEIQREGKRLSAILVRPAFHAREILKVFSNGFSEMTAHISSSVVGALYSLQLFGLAGENGVAAYGDVICILYAVFIGYSMGYAPVISHHYGAHNHTELQSLYRKSLTIIGGCSVLLTLLGVLLASPSRGSMLDTAGPCMTCPTAPLHCIRCPSCFAALTSSVQRFFTALNDGLISAVISLSRTLLFHSLTILVLPIFLGIDGIWLSIGAAELLALIVTAFFFARKRGQYHYAQ